MKKLSIFETPKYNFMKKNIPCFEVIASATVEDANCGLLAMSAYSQLKKLHQVL